MKNVFLGMFTAAAFFAAPAMAEVPGSKAANTCQLEQTGHLGGASASALSDEVWPGVKAWRVARFFNDNTRTYFYTRDLNEITQLCHTAGWRTTTWAGSTPHNFRAAAHPFNGGLPVYSFRHTTNSSYYYTTKHSEYVDLLSNSAARWTYVGIPFYLPDIAADGNGGQLNASSSAYATNFPRTCLSSLPSLKDGLVVAPKDCMQAPAPSTGLTPVYRFYSPTRGYYYTANRAEAEFAALNGATSTYGHGTIAFWAFSPELLSQPDLPAWITGVPYPN